MKMQHPKNDGKPIEVASDQASNYESQGWVEVKPAPKPFDDSK